MIQRVLVSKTSKSGVVTQAVMYKGKPLSRGITLRYGFKDGSVTALMVDVYPDKINLNCDMASAKDFFESNNKLNALVLLDGDCGFKNLSEQCKDGELHNLIDTDSTVRSGLINLANSMFSKVNTKTNSKDVLSSKYAQYIPLVVVSGVLPPQLDDNCTSYFNPQGQVSLTRALDSLNAMTRGYHSLKERRKSLDGICDVSDFFNEGYNKCLTSMASPFYSLYRRDEFSEPLFISELCYIIVTCFKDFIDKFGSVEGSSELNKHRTGVTLDWEHPKKIIKEYRERYSDMNDYVVTRCSTDIYTKENDTISVLDINIKSYTNRRTMKEFKKDLLSGKTALPLPYLMSMLELDRLGILSLSGSELSPLKEVSRGEFAQLLFNLSEKLYVE